MKQQSTSMPPEYRTLLRQWNEYVKRARYGLTDEERAEMDALAAQLESYELAHRQQSVFDQVTTDYRDLRYVGDLGGCEIL